MKRNWIFVHWLVTLAVIVALAAAAPGLAALRTAVAQGGDDPSLSSAQYPPEAAQPAGAAQGEPWTSSAEPPPGTPLELLSPPDSVAASAVDDTAAIEALVSLRVVGSSLKPRASNVSYTVNDPGGCTYVTAGNAFTVWNTTPALPQGARVDTLRMYYLDQSPNNFTSWFTVYDLYGAIVQEWSVSTSGNFGNSFNDSATISHTVDYSLYSYVLNWRPGVVTNTLQLCGFRIFYEPPAFGVNFLPNIHK